METFIVLGMLGVAVFAFLNYRNYREELKEKEYGNAILSFKAFMIILQIESCLFFFYLFMSNK